MAKDACIRCGKGRYAEIDRETDFQGRTFILFECGQCQSLVIRRDGWNPADWEKATLGE